MASIDSIIVCWVHPVRIARPNTNTPDRGRIIQAGLSVDALLDDDVAVDGTITLILPRTTHLITAIYANISALGTRLADALRVNADTRAGARLPATERTWVFEGQHFAFEYAHGLLTVLRAIAAVLSEATGAITA